MGGRERSRYARRCGVLSSRGHLPTYPLFNVLFGHHAVSGCLLRTSSTIDPGNELSHTLATSVCRSPSCCFRRQSPSRTMGGRARSAAGSPSRLGRTAAGLAVGESSALLMTTPLAIGGGTGMWDGDAEDPALRSVSPSCIGLSCLELFWWEFYLEIFFAELDT